MLLNKVEIVWDRKDLEEINNLFHTEGKRNFKGQDADDDRNNLKFKKKVVKFVFLMIFKVNGKES